MLITLSDNFKGCFEKYPFTVLDAGARDGIKNEWGGLKPYLRYIAFEPDEAECARLKASSTTSSKIAYHDTALWDSKQNLVFNITKVEGLSSAHLPNYDFLNHFNSENVDGYALQHTITVKSDKLDDILSAHDKKSLDFIKIDVEGCAYQVLRGAEETLLKNIVSCIRLEAEFNEKYKGQHLFSDIDRLLRNYGYQLFDIKACSWKRKAGLKTGGLRGQLIHGDFLYVMDLDVFFRKINGMNGEERSVKVIRYITILCLYGCYDLAYELLSNAREKQFISQETSALLEKALKKSRAPLARIPKLQGKDAISNLIYHFVMLTFGTYLERKGFWRPRVRIAGGKP